jgi:hypothetical protein
MALTGFQRGVCRIIARNRIRGGESYVAGGAALATITASPRISRDIDLFHDSVEAVAVTWEADRGLLESNGYAVAVRRQFAGFVEALVSQPGGQVVLQWVRDSAYRFFPLVEHADFGLTLHPFDLAINKVLALVGRLEARDWIDVHHCHERIQRLGLLVWAGCGKDPGLSPRFILEQAGRSAHYSQAEIAKLEFEGAPPDAVELSRRWMAMMTEAREIVEALPPEHAGKCVLSSSGVMFREGLTELRRALADGRLRFHEGSLRGALPQVAS